MSQMIYLRHEAKHEAKCIFESIRLSSRHRKTNAARTLQQPPSKNPAQRTHFQKGYATFPPRQTHSRHGTIQEITRASTNPRRQPRGYCAVETIPRDLGYGRSYGTGYALWSPSPSDALCIIPTLSLLGLLHILHVEHIQCWLGKVS
jgi:hypothetical protein